MSLIVAQQKLQADIHGITAHDDQVAPAAESVVHNLATDLGGLNFLFEHSAPLEVAVLPRASSSTRGPNGGLIPSTLANTARAGVTRVDGALESATAAVTHSATPFGDAVRSVVSRVRTTLRI